MPIAAHDELGFDDLDDLVSELSQKNYYPILFEAAYGTEEVTEERIANALAQFIRSITGYNTRFDQGATLEGGNFAATFSNYDVLENKGKDLFLIHCASCHQLPNFTQKKLQPRNVGLYMSYPDDGLGEVTGDPADDGKFKVPTLRNISHTGPYMHDGSITTIYSAVVHYSDDVEAHENLDPLLRDPSDIFKKGVIPKQLKLDSYERDALVAFLYTLTDYDLLTNEKWSDPWRVRTEN